MWLDARNWALYQRASCLVARRMTRGSKESGLSQNTCTTTTTLRFLIVVMSHGNCCCLAKSLASPGSANKNTSAINRGSAVRIIKLLSVDNLLVEYRSLG